MGGLIKESKLNQQNPIGGEMKAAQILITFLALPTSVWASQYSQLAIDSDVIVPIVNSDSDVTVRAGNLYYDIGVGLKIVNPSGSVEVLSFTGVSPISTGGSSERVERAMITNSGSPTISQQSGSWLTSLTDNGVGDVSLNITGSTFSSAPTCVVSANGTGGFGTRVQSSSTSAVRINTLTTGAGSPVDVDFTVICMGPK